MLADIDYYFFALPVRGHVYDMPDLTDEERSAEHGLRHDLLLKLYDELEPAFDVSLSLAAARLRGERGRRVSGY